jgi:TolA-binding protein
MYIHYYLLSFPFAEDSIRTQLREMEGRIAEMVSENKQNLVAKVVAENKVDRLQREVASLKAAAAAGATLL